MTSNLDRFKKDFEALLRDGESLQLSMQLECFPETFPKALEKVHGAKAKEIEAALPSFEREYQKWYSAAKVLIKQLLPDRLSDFVRHYEKPRPRKELTNESYRIEDYLQGLSVTRGVTKIVEPAAALPHFSQQLAIVKSVKERFESSLFEVRQLVQADLFDSEVDTARELAKNKFLRAAGAVAGVVLEKHLAEVAQSHAVKGVKKSPTIADLNNLLKEAGVIEIPQWRFIQHLADLRNLCDHNRQVEPTADQVADLIDGVAKITKTLF